LQTPVEIDLGGLGAEVRQSHDAGGEWTIVGGEDVPFVRAKIANLSEGMIDIGAGLGMMFDSYEVSLEPQQDMFWEGMPIYASGSPDDLWVFSSGGCWRISQGPPGASCEVLFDGGFFNRGEDSWDESSAPHGGRVPGDVEWQTG